MTINTEKAPRKTRSDYKSGCVQLCTDPVLEVICGESGHSGRSSEVVEDIQRESSKVKEDIQGGHLKFKQTFWGIIRGEKGDSEG
jgi:hypothetical protein